MRCFTRGCMNTFRPRSRLHVHRLMFTALAQAVRWQLVTRNVCELVQPPQVRSREMQTLDANQVRALLDSVADENSTPADACALAVLTGLRLGELLGLRWADIDSERGTLSVRRTLQRLSGNQPAFREPKTKRSQRTIYWGPATSELLQRLRRRQKEAKLVAYRGVFDADLLFVNDFGVPLSRWTLRDSYHRLLAKAGLPRIRFHDLRHTYASLQIQVGTHAKVISEHLGHSNIGTTMDTYGHIFPGLQAQATADFEMWLANRTPLPQTGNGAPPAWWQGSARVTGPTRPVPNRLTTRFGLQSCGLEGQRLRLRRTMAAKRQQIVVTLINY